LRTARATSRRFGTERSFFVDNTHHIRLLESGYQYLFVRPPRFGKSLFVETLRHYYDCAASQAEFDALFGGLDAHTNATPLARSFHVLKLDFSIERRRRRRPEL
jgi:hypothetical protein